MRHQASKCETIHQNALKLIDVTTFVRTITTFKTCRNVTFRHVLENLVLFMLRVLQPSSLHNTVSRKLRCGAWPVVDLLVLHSWLVVPDRGGGGAAELRVALPRRVQLLQLLLHDVERFFPHIISHGMTKSAKITLFRKFHFWKCIIPQKLHLYCKIPTNNVVYYGKMPQNIFYIAKFRKSRVWYYEIHKKWFYI